METPQTYHVRTIETSLMPDATVPHPASVRIPICNVHQRIVAYGTGDTLTQAHANAEAIASAFDALGWIYRCCQIHLDHAKDDVNWRDFASRIRNKAGEVLYPELPRPNAIGASATYWPISGL